MIRKILEIKNLGSFISPIFGNPNWNGVLEKINVIYANNGSGKTTLTMLFRSLKGKNALLNFKKSFHSTDPISIKMMGEDNKPVNYSAGKWNKFVDKIEVFNSHFIEDNVHLITIKEDSTKPDIFEILSGNEGDTIRKQITDLKQVLLKFKNRRSNLRRERNKVTDAAKIQDYEKRLTENALEKAKIAANIRDKEKLLSDATEKYRDLYLERINNYLNLFNPSIRLSKLTQQGLRVLYSIEITGYDVKKDANHKQSLKYVLSEGDKNSLAFSFFLAKLDLLPDLSDYMIVIDDPITSFDYARKATTVNNLISLTEKVKMLILLTHDLTFANDFSSRLNYKANNLKIEHNGTTSFIINHDIESESLTGVFKDLSVMHNYLSNGAVSDIERREVLRCIRPSLEGIFRIKFFKEFKKNEWLGDIIDKIVNADSTSNYFRYKNILDELTEINHYSKKLHHTDPYTIESPINHYELRNYVLRTLELIRQI